MSAAAQERGLPFGRPLTRADLARVPYNGKCELIDGVLVVTREGDPFTQADLEATPDDGHRYEAIDDGGAGPPAGLKLRAGPGGG